MKNYNITPNKGSPRCHLGSQYAILNTLYTLALVLLPALSVAQHGLSFSQFGQVRNSFNSSLSTMDSRGGFSVLGRGQWMGVDGAPRVIWGSGHVGLADIGATIGADIRHAQLGVFKDSEASIYFAKRIRLAERDYLSLSMGGGFIYFNGDYGSLDGSDPAFSETVSETSGLLSISTSYYSPERYYFGVAMPRFSLNRKNRYEYEFGHVIYVSSGALFRLDESFHLRPSLLVSKMKAQILRFEFNAVAFVARKIGFGLGVQNQGDLSALLQFNFGSLGFGYSYQFSPKSSTMNQRISTNTHELGLRYSVAGLGLL